MAFVLPARAGMFNDEYPAIDERASKLPILVTLLGDAEACSLFWRSQAAAQTGQSPPRSLRLRACDIGGADTFQSETVPNALVDDAPQLLRHRYAGVARGQRR